MFHPLPTDLQVPPGAVVEVTVGGKIFCVAHSGDQLFAFSRLCPHSGAPFCDGWVDVRGHLICPLHKYRFDMRNGYNVSGEGYVLRRYALERRADGWYVNLPE